VLCTPPPLPAPGGAGYVLLTVNLSFESFAAEGAEERFVHLVCCHVSPDTTGGRKVAVADTTLVQLYSGVCVDVHVEAAAGHELLVALEAMVGSLSRMLPCVLFEMRGFLEGGSAVRALVLPESNLQRRGVVHTREP